MFPYRSEWTSILVAGLVVACAGSGLGADKARPEEALAKLGLKRAGDLWVLEAESEIRGKIGEAKRLSSQLSQALLQQRGMVGEKEYQATLKELNNQISQLRSELNATNQQMRQVPRYRGRIINNLVGGQYAQLAMYRNQLQAEINQRTYLLGQLKSQPFDPKARQKVEAEVRDRREALHQAVGDLRRLVDATCEKYAGLAKDPGVKKALDAIAPTAGAKPKLGPSREFLSNLKLLERLEKQDSAGEAGDPTAGPARKTRRAIGGKRSHKAAGGSGVSASPF